MTPWAICEREEHIHNRILYTGQQYDQVTGQYYLRVRFYNPVVGRFLQEDEYRGDGLNLYAYCGNNPPHNNSIEAELDWASSVGATNIAKNRNQRDANGNRVYYTDPVTGKPRYIKPDASDNIDGVRFNTNYVSDSNSSSEMEREINAFNHMAEADPDAVNTLIINYDDPLAPKSDEKKDDKGKGEKCP